MRKLFILLTAFTTVFALNSRAQLVVDSLSIQEYVQDVLLGSGIQATNITYTGCFEQIGYMHEGASAGLGLDGGVVLSSDHSHNIEVPSPNNWLGQNGCTTVSGEPDLLSIANSVPGLIGQSFSVNSHGARPNSTTACCARSCPTQLPVPSGTRVSPTRVGPGSIAASSLT